MALYVDDYRREEHVAGSPGPWSHLLADTPGELDQVAAALGLAGHVLFRGAPWAYVCVDERERLAAVVQGARQISWRAGLQMMRDRVAAAGAELAARAPVEFTPSIPGRHRTPLHVLFDQQAPDLPAGTFVCVRGPRPARWNRDKPRHAWDEPKEHWHRCVHCRIIYRSVPVPGPGTKWAKQWEYPDLFGGSTADGSPFPACLGPNHPHMLQSSLDVATVSPAAPTESR